MRSCALFIVTTGTATSTACRREGVVEVLGLRSGCHPSLQSDNPSACHFRRSWTEGGNCRDDICVHRRFRNAISASTPRNSPRSVCAPHKRTTDSPSRGTVHQHRQTGNQSSAAFKCPIFFVSDLRSRIRSCALSLRSQDTARDTQRLESAASGGEFNSHGVAVDGTGGC